MIIPHSSSAPCICKVKQRIMTACNQSEFHFKWRSLFSIISKSSLHFEYFDTLSDLNSSSTLLFIRFYSNSIVETKISFYFYSNSIVLTVFYALINDHPSSVRARHKKLAGAPITRRSGSFPLIDHFTVTVTVLQDPPGLMTYTLHLPLRIPLIFPFLFTFTIVGSAET